MGIIKEVFPPVEDVLELEPEELASYVLECLCREAGMLNRYNFTLANSFKDYCEPPQFDAIAKAVTEAWVWLEHEGLVAPQPGNPYGDWCYVTKRGEKFRGTNIITFKATRLLPHEMLEPRLAAKVRPPFLRGEYDSAIFEAFKEVEISVRKLAALNLEDLGVNLMRKAFEPEDGPLVAPEQVTSEREGTSALFAGAIACFKNPSSHRDVNFNDPVEAVELIMFADLLIKIAERRKPERT